MTTQPTVHPATPATGVLQGMPTEMGLRPGPGPRAPPPGSAGGR